MDFIFICWNHGICRAWSVPGHDTGAFYVGVLELELEEHIVLI